MTNYDECYFPGCKETLVYAVEWHGVNQHGGNAEVVCERRTCDTFKHIVYAAHHDTYGGVPDEILKLMTDSNKDDSAPAELLEEVIKAMEQWKNLDLTRDTA